MHTDSTQDWWDAMLAGRMADGVSDANSGKYELPYPASEDPQDDAENEAYKRGFFKRRKELGDAFKWA